MMCLLLLWITTEEDVVIGGKAWKKKNQNKDTSEPHRSLIIVKATQTTQART
jgi:hypothetical protein